MIVTLAIHLTFTYFFVFNLMLPKADEILLINPEKVYGYYFITAVYLTCLVMALLALLMLYTVGPGYLTDHFKSVKIEPLDMMMAPSVNDDNEIVEEAFSENSDYHGKQLMTGNE